MSSSSSSRSPDRRGAPSDRTWQRDAVPSTPALFASRVPVEHCFGAQDRVSRTVGRDILQPRSAKRLARVRLVAQVEGGLTLDLVTTGQQVDGQRTRGVTGLDQEGRQRRRPPRGPLGRVRHRRGGAGAEKGALVGTSAAATPTRPTTTITAPSTAHPARCTPVIRRRERLRFIGAGRSPRSRPAPGGGLPCYEVLAGLRSRRPVSHRLGSGSHECRIEDYEPDSPNFSALALRGSRPGRLPRTPVFHTGAGRSDDRPVGRRGRLVGGLPGSSHSPVSPGRTTGWSRNGPVNRGGRPVPSARRRCRCTMHDNGEALLGLDRRETAMLTWAGKDWVASRPPQPRARCRPPRTSPRRSTRGPT